MAPAIACDNGAHSVGLTWWVLAREVLRMHDTISCEHPGRSCPIFPSMEMLTGIEKEERVAAKKVVTKEAFQGEWTAPAPEFTDAQPEVVDWSGGVQELFGPIPQFPMKTGLQLPPFRPLNE
ncbi:hypothetical protein MJG53_014491 [Ovis ammon polii x Ovis aries]|uniref:40S ribosomal protein SA C-terminal domain-containing protein n=2 Tax=Ovis TaxID=9935 RepID=A0A835ZQ29_SHEEP|nr:hypothetical protein JEQ12_007361 [Ovis aries]KAI4568873.1 hypothetical protein MJG53_014491 [Ovis ammon polii x Ovis aries]